VAQAGSRTTNGRRHKKQAAQARVSRRKHLDSLSNLLLLRHLQESWPERLESNPAWFGDGELPPGYQKNLRTVAVVGAGASYPMESIADELVEDLEMELGGDSREREVELDRLENVYGLDRKNFETRLTAICRTPEAERKVRERISERYRHRHPSLLTYELLAHLLHHRFLDAIISFNFDELLDQAIEDELGPNEYTPVITERDCDPGVPTPAPLYIKMHGTASEPDSLRFTRERYYWTPKSIIELVEKQFEVEQLVVMNVGCRMSSFDFQYLLRKPDHLRIFHLDPNRLKRNVRTEIKKQREKERGRQKVQRPDSNDRPVVADFSQRGKAGADFLPELLTEVIVALRKRCLSTPPTEWRSTLRHRAVVEILEGSQTNTPTQYAEYLRRRTILEFAFAAARGRGVLSIASMVDDRCGRYYDRYQRVAGDGADSWRKLCEAGGLQESKEWPNTYEVLKGLGPAEEREAKNVHQLWPANPQKLADHTLKSMNVPGKPTRFRKLLTETLKFLQEETEIEVHSRDDRVCSKTFVKPVILRTFTALQGWTRYMLEATEDYNEVWAVSETGAWIARKETLKALENHEKGAPGSKREPIRLRLLTAFDPETTDPVRRLSGGVEMERLPWGRHNRHMTIVCKNGQPRAAIYFVRRLRAPTVTPVYLSHQQDLKRIVEAFEKLWEEAEQYAGKRETSAPPPPKQAGPARRNGRPKRNGREPKSGNRLATAARRS
jgi:hypothetical protein